MTIIGMNSKSLLIAIAAFAVTATGAQAFVSKDYLNRAGLSTVQVEALTQARELRLKGKNDEARDVLLEAGFNSDTLDNLRKANHGKQHSMHEALHNEDYAAFRLAIEGTPLYDLITTEADFGLFKEAHELKKAGNLVEAKEIFSGLGVLETVHFGFKAHIKFSDRQSHDLSQLSAEQIDSLQAAKEANDKETVRAILLEAGLNEGRSDGVRRSRSWQ